MRWLALLVTVACGSGRPPLPELDADDWCHVQELASPERPNGSTHDLERAVAIANQNHWPSNIDDNRSISPATLPGFDAAMAVLRRWRDAGGGALLMSPTGFRDPAEMQIGLWPALVATDDAEAINIVSLIGQRTIDQSGDLLNLAVAYSIADAAIERGRHHDLVIDPAARRRAVVRAFAGEVVWARHERERLTNDSTIDADWLRQMDHQVQTMLAVLRDVQATTTERELFDRLRTADRTNDVTNRAIDVEMEMLTKWRFLNDRAERYVIESHRKAD